MKMFIDGYTTGGALADLIKYILDKMEDLKSKHVLNNECDLKRPIRNIDEGCHIDCLTLQFKQSHEMVTKQKLKAFIRCSMNCKEDVNDWV